MQHQQQTVVRMVRMVVVRMVRMVRPSALGRDMMISLHRAHAGGVIVRALCERHSKTARGRAGACWTVVWMAVRMVVRVVRMVVWLYSWVVLTLNNCGLTRVRGLLVVHACVEASHRGGGLLTRES